MAPPGPRLSPGSAANFLQRALRSPPPTFFAVHFSRTRGPCPCSLRTNGHLDAAEVRAAQGGWSSSAIACWPPPASGLTSADPPTTKPLPTCPPACPGPAPSPSFSPLLSGGLRPHPSPLLVLPGSVPRSCDSIPTLCPDCQPHAHQGSRPACPQPPARCIPPGPTGLHSSPGLPLPCWSPGLLPGKAPSAPSMQVEMPHPLNRLLPPRPPSSCGLTKADSHYP